MLNITCTLSTQQAKILPSFALKKLILKKNAYRHRPAGLKFPAKLPQEQRLFSSDATNVCTDAAQFIDQSVITAVDMVNVADFSLTLGNKSGQHKRRSGP